MSEKQQELEKKLKDLIADDRFYIQAFGLRTEEINGVSSFITPFREVQAWDRNDLANFEKKILALENAKKEILEKDAIEKVFRDRRSEYEMVDHLFLEALAEKEEGRPEKMVQYLELRKKIKEKYPKV
tara:strand:+ start:292 stop:675 length:384 start_codon:yes stop_codon:yes gene_type:complete